MSTPDPLLLQEFSDDHGNRCLPPIIYEKAENAGWRVPDIERRRWDRPVHAPQTAPPGTGPRELASLVSEARLVFYVSPDLSEMLARAHAADDLATTRCVEDVLARAGEFKSPGGLLYKRLEAIRG